MITNEKLKTYYKGVSLLGEALQLIDKRCIRLVQQGKSKRKSNEEDQKQTEKFPEMLNSLPIYDNPNMIKLENIWGIDKREDVDSCIIINGEAGIGKSVLTKMISYLWANDQMWNDRFSLLLRISLREIVDNFDKTNGKSDGDGDIKKQWSEIMKRLIPGLNEQDTKHIMHSKNDLLLILDGFDEIVNELNTNMDLREWLKYCTKKGKYCVIMTSRLNATCSYLRKKSIRLNVICFQKQDIQNYVRTYLKNPANGDYNYQADSLIKTIDENPLLQLLSCIPLYLNFLCYLTKQQKIQNENQHKDDLFHKFDCMSVLKLLLKYKLNEQDMFNTFEMEIDYLSQLAWEGLKSEQE
ncbi:NTPase, partial [Reticulomyxa filosa]